MYEINCRLTCNGYDKINVEHFLRFRTVSVVRKDAKCAQFHFREEETSMQSEMLLSELDHGLPCNLCGSSDHKIFSA